MRSYLRHPIHPVVVFIFIFGLCSAQNSWAWGLRGHGVVCEAAVHLIKDESLRFQFRQRLPEITALCNIPDTHWKALGGEVRAKEFPTHYVNPELLGFTAKTLPTDFALLRSQFEGAPSESPKRVASVASEMGSLWWRAEQLVRESQKLMSELKTLSPPSNSKEERQAGLPFNQKARRIFELMGVLGHYVGDAGQPYHTTRDYDGYQAGHGGIHNFIDHELPPVMDEKLMADVVARARVLSKKWPAGKNPAEDMKALSVFAYEKIPQVLKLDPVIQKSKLVSEKGMEIKTEATRRPSASVAGAFRPLVVDCMAASALTLAKFWESIAPSGAPLTRWKDYDYSFKPEWIEPSLPAKP